MRRRGGKDITSVDTYLNGFSTVAALCVLLLLLINPPAETSDGDPPPGSLSIYSSWQDGPIDIDQWVKDPSGEIVGFSAKTGTNTSLLKDDLGTSADAAGAGNFENTYIRALPPGEYVVNLVCYTCPTVPITVNVEIRAARPGEASVKLITTTVTLTEKRQEKTAVRFRLDASGHLVEGSVHSVHLPLYYIEGRV